VAVVQNKAELCSSEAALASHSQIQSFVAGTTAEAGPIIPLSAHSGRNLCALAEWLVMQCTSYIPLHSYTPLILLSHFLFTSYVLTHHSYGHS
jgi:translation initiation factor 2 gamma subunit (eIF-2gamma)